MPQHLLLLIPSDSCRAADFLKAADAAGVDLVVACDQHQTLEQVEAALRKAHQSLSFVISS